MNLPKPKLGNVYSITIGTTDLENSLSYYQKLGFKELYRADFPFPWIQITDGALLIMLRKMDEPYIALTYYANDYDKLIADLEQEGIQFKMKPNPSDMVKRALVESPDGMIVSLISFVEGFSQPAGATMLTTAPQDFNNSSKYVNQVCGMFGEFAHPVKDFDASVKFWEKLGFKVLHQTDVPYKWGIISDGLSILGLHQTDTFSKPTITFFASDMKEKIQKLKSEGLENFTDKGENNTVLITPEDQRINLFKLGF